MIHQSQAWQTLAQRVQDRQQVTLQQRFADDPNRFRRYSASACGLTLDYSKNHVGQKTLSLLLKLAEEAGMAAAIEAMFQGEKINATEQRAVLHTALRAPQTSEVMVDGVNVIPEIQGQLDKMAELVEAVHEGRWLGYDNQPITDVVNLGIGGSDLGPRMVCQALSAYHTSRVTCHFVSNVDGASLVRVLSSLNPATTLFIIASKSFTTQETLMNALSARAWLLDSAPNEQATSRHFVAISSQVDKAKAFGIDAKNVFAMWDWVGGRYSLWSTIGMPIAMAVGMENFRALLSGAHEMDQHFRTASLHQNLPVLLALLGILYHNFYQAESYAVLPYDDLLSELPNYLQQLDMESNGKRVNRNGETVDYQTGPILWGGVGTNGQHAFHQLLHQGTELVPVDFILPRQSHYPLAHHHAALYANCLAQSQALMQGKTVEQAIAELKQQGLGEEEAKALAPHKVIPGNKPSNTIVMEQVTPETLGAFIAMYEHKVFAQSVVWQINAFDQWGVELGKQLGKPIFDALLAGKQLDVDSSTTGLAALFSSGNGTGK